MVRATADACTILAARCVDGATTDGDVAAGLLLAAADARSISIASGVECPAALEGKVLALRYEDARALVSSLHGVGRVSP